MKFFDSVIVTKPRSNMFDLSHEKKLTCNMGDLIPILLEEVLPGDSFNVNSEILLRLQPLIAPTMHRVDVFTHYFFVPNRIVWEDWEKFITGGEDGLDETQPPHLTINNSNGSSFRKGMLPDHFGIPPVTAGEVISNEIEISQLPFRAYLKIYNDYYRDQNLQVPVEPSGSVELTKIRKRAWEKDYFTSCLPFAQKGGDVNLPVNSSFTPQYREVSNSYNINSEIESEGNLEVDSGTIETPTSLAGVQIRNLNTEQEVTSTSVTINELRIAERLQQWLEKNARGGSRYIEQMLVHFGKKSSDSRLQRPEYLGGGKQAVVMSEVLSNAEVDNAASPGYTIPQGTMAGHGISIGKSNGFKKEFEEHGYIIGIMSVMPRTTYQQGINKTFLRKTKLEYYWPTFSQLGEQEVSIKELYTGYHDPLFASDLFGYQSRYAEYKYKSSQVSGDMRENMDFWHFGRIFANKPELNEEFIKANVRYDAFAVNSVTEDHLIVQIYNKVHARRPIPFNNVPKL